MFLAVPMISQKQPLSAAPEKKIERGIQVFQASGELNISQKQPPPLPRKNVNLNLGVPGQSVHFVDTCAKYYAAPLEHWMTRFRSIRTFVQIRTSLVDVRKKQVPNSFV